MVCCFKFFESIFAFQKKRPDFDLIYLLLLLYPLVPYPFYLNKFSIILHILYKDQIKRINPKTLLFC